MRPQKNENLTRVNVYLTKVQWEALGGIARATGLSASEHLRRALDAYLDTAEEKDGQTD